MTRNKIFMDVFMFQDDSSIMPNGKIKPPPPPVRTVSRPPPPPPNSRRPSQPPPPPPNVRPPNKDLPPPPPNHVSCQSLIIICSHIHVILQCRVHLRHPRDGNQWESSEGHILHQQSRLNPDLRGNFDQCSTFHLLKCSVGVRKRIKARMQVW